MSADDYKAMLKSVEQALAICRDSLGKMDATHQHICDDLRDARDRLLELLKLPPKGEASSHEIPETSRRQLPSAR